MKTKTIKIMEANTITVTTRNEYIKNMTGVLSNDELVQAIEAQLKAKKEVFCQDNIEILLENVKTTIEQYQHIKELYVDESDTPNNEKWSRVRINYIRKMYTQIMCTQIILYF